jgi:hypothetical protein
MDRRRPGRNRNRSRPVIKMCATFGAGWRRRGVEKGVSQEQKEEADVVWCLQGASRASEKIFGRLEQDALQSRSRLFNFVLHIP